MCHTFFQKFYLKLYAFSKHLRFGLKSIAHVLRVPVRLKMLKGGRVAITLLGQPACLSITASPHNLGVWVSWQGENWDALLDLDISGGEGPEVACVVPFAKVCQSKFGQTPRHSGLTICLKDF